MENKEYTTRQEQLARFAKAMGHPARVAFLEILSGAELLFLRRHPRSVAYLESDSFSTSERVERCRADTGRDRNTESKILYQSGELGSSVYAFFRFFRAMYV